jgi:hypothetical protein
MKSKNLAVLVSVSLLAISANAQPAGVYIVIERGTNFIAPNSTNFYFGTYLPAVLSVHDYTNAAFTVTCAADAASTGTVTFRWRKSFDGGSTFEDTPSVSTELTLKGTNRVGALFNVHVPSETHLELYDAWNTNGIAITNISISCNLKMVKWAARRATQ